MPSKPPLHRSRLSFQSMHRRLINSSQWTRFRRWFLSRHPLCSDCGEAANVVHHVAKRVEAPRLAYVEDNCMALCETCHNVRTARGE